MIAFYFFAAVSVWIGWLSLRNGFHFRNYIKSLEDKEEPDFTPFASVIAPCRGADHDLYTNICALLRQQYPAYQVVFVTDRADDPSVTVIERAMREIHGRQHPTVRLVVAGDAVDCGQKVHNLRFAIGAVASETEVLVFVDTDAQPKADWLRSLVAPLIDDRWGATTGYRWFIPLAGGLASHVRSVWNASIASALGARGERNFCWGGSTAIRKQLFAELRIADYWQGAVSDDFTITRVLKEKKLPIRFVPRCLVPSFDSCSFLELLEFSNRQLKITRTYAPHLWRPLLLGSLLFSAVFFGGLAMTITSSIRGNFDWVVGVSLLIIFLLGTIKSYVRLRAVSLVLDAPTTVFRRSTLPHLLLWPIASLLFLLNCVVAVWSKRIEWRGITYQLKSANEAVIITRKST